MSLKETLQSIHEKKEGIKEDCRGARDELRNFRPRPVQNFVYNRVRRRRNSIERRRSHGLLS